MPKKQAAEGGEERTTVANGESLAPDPASIAPAPHSGLNGSLLKETPGRTSIAENTESLPTFINGGIINKRYSYSSNSMASESMDMSIHKGNISLTARVSRDDANLRRRRSLHNVL